MCDKIKICIADDNRDAAKSLANYLSMNERIYVTDICLNGKEAVKSLLREAADFLITDIIMPEIDGIGVIEEVNKEVENGTINKKPNIIIVSAIVQDNLKFDIFNKGVNYYMSKPLDIGTLEKRIIEIYDYDKNNAYRQKEMDNNITQALYEIGIYPNLTGYKYIKKAIELLVDNPTIHKDFRKNIYSVIAKDDGNDAGKVERSITNAVNTSWHKEKENISKILKNTKYYNKKPSTRIFLSTIAEEVRKTI